MLINYENKLKKNTSVTCVKDTKVRIISFGCDAGLHLTFKY